MLDVWFFWCQGVSQDLHNLVIYFWHFLGAHSQPSNCKHWPLSVSLSRMTKLCHFSFYGFPGVVIFGKKASTPVPLCKLGNMGSPTLVHIIKSIKPVIGLWHLKFSSFPGGSLDLQKVVIYLPFPLCKQPNMGLPTLVPISFPVSDRGKCWPVTLFLLDG